MDRTHTCLFFIILFFSHSLVHAQLDVGLVSYYSFSGNADDFQGFANPSDVYGAQLVPDKDTVADMAYSFDGTNDYIDTHTSFDYPYRTISLWFKADDVSGSGDQSKVIINMDGTPLQYGGLYIQIIDGQLTMAAALDAVPMEATIEADRWYHVVIIRNGDQTSYFLNGTHLGDGLSTTLTSTANPYPYVVIGTDRERNRRWFDGIIDEIRIYNRVLSTSEIAQLLQCDPSHDNDWVFSHGNTDLDPIYHRGNVAIGMKEAGNYKLAIDGITRTNEIEVQPEGWSDYILKDDYKLMELGTLEQFIKQHGHLPDVPTEKNVLENGIGLGDFASTLLAKIEELTLYLIKQDKEIQELRGKISSYED